MKITKLVRDKIPEIIAKDGKKPIIRIASKKEYWERLLEKLEEEVKEFKNDPNIEELVDVLEIIYAIAEYIGFDKNRLEAIRKKKAKERGSFKKRIIWEGNEE